VESAPEVKYRSILDLDIPIEWVNTGDSGNTGNSGNTGITGNSGNTGSTENTEDTEITDFHEQFVGESFGRINKAEAELTLDTVQHYFERIGKQRLLDERIDVGIISPYRAQVQYLRRLLMKREYFKPFRRLISINTVDGFQGQERDVIVISMVRSNDEGQIGFLRDLRRMNVAITRARMKLIIIGNQKTMTRHTFYRQLWRYIKGLSGEENQWSGEEELLSGEEKEGYSDNTDESTYDTLEGNGLVE
jgi:superfamily I DNA and/or RNA helicase